MRPRAMRSRISCTRISADVPGSVPSPASFSSARYSLIGMPERTAPSRMRRTSREARSSVAPGLPAAPVLMRLPHEPVGVDERGDPRAERLVEELRAGGDVRVDGESLAQDEAGALGGATQLDEAGPRLLGIDVIGRQRRDAAP